MEYRAFGSGFVLRLDPGEEILACLRELCEQEDIGLGSVTGLGAVDYVEAGLYELATKSYRKNVFEGEAEIVSLTGNISRMSGECYLHCHIAVSDETGATRGGHLNEARVSATAEIFVTVTQGEVGRKKDPQTGLNIIEF
ncbi:MAG: DNA-binding protein [Oscillospiraceae bacterium]|jgi:predicted DNA-binding protein with PD1-like motif|nr:DNA-binding protein [Oscillospiraceae bacterium]